MAEQGMPLRGQGGTPVMGIDASGNAQFLGASAGGSTPVSPADPVTGAYLTGDDAAIAPSTVTTPATVNQWIQLMPANPARQGAAVQNKSATSCFIVSATSQPATGTVAGELEIPATPTYFKFDWVPKKQYWVRNSVASQALTLIVW